VVEPTNIIEILYNESASQLDEGQDNGHVAEEKLMTGLEWLRSRTSQTFGLVSDSEESDIDEKKDEKRESSDNEDDEGGKQAPTLATQQTIEPSAIGEEQPAAPKMPAAETKILKTGRLFVRNLAYDVIEDDLHEIFSPFGQIEEVCLPHTL
jgi:multiple RNA-binding domain-containing protein 1